MYRFVLLLACCVLVAPIVTAGVVGASDEVTVSVHVVDDDGDDVPGATVTASWDDEDGVEGGSASGETVSNGQTLIDVPSGADVELAVEDDDLVQNHPKRVGTVTGHTDVTVELFPETTATVAVTEDGEPIADASVALTKTDDDRTAASGTTNADGEFTADGLEEGTYDVTAEQQGYYDASAVADFARSDETTVSMEPGTVDVSVTITDGYLDEPLESEVTFRRGGDHDATVSTDEDGQRTIGLEVNTEYTVVVEKAGYGETDRDLTVGESDLGVSYAVERAPAVTVVPSNERVLVGETVGVDVTDEYDDPIEGADVRLDGETVATTAADGSATVPIEEAGERELTAVAGDTTSEAVTVDGVDPGANDDDAADEGSDEGGDESGDETDGMPGFGALAALVALGGWAFVRRRHR